MAVRIVNVEFSSVDNLHCFTVSHSGCSNNSTDLCSNNISVESSENPIRAEKAAECENSSDSHGHIISKPKKGLRESFNLVLNRFFHSQL